MTQVQDTAHAPAMKAGRVPVQPGEVRDIALNKLKASPRNARRVGHSAEDIEARAASIRFKGLLQPLVVEPEVKEGGQESGYYLVTIGEGRRQALKLLAKRKLLSKTEPVRCVVDTTNDPAEISLDENISRRDDQEVHDIQGFHDNGVDILLKYETRDGNVRRAGIQIKSEAEFRDWEAKRLDMIKTLKSQYSEAFEDARVHEYYIVLCVDAVRHQERIRTLNAKMMNYKNCSIIEPIDILDLLEADNLAVTRRVTRLLCQNDRVLNGAIEALNAEDVDVAFFIITLMCQAFDGDLLVSQVRLKEIWTEWEDFAKDRAGSDERLMLVLSALDTAGTLSDDGDGWSINVDQLPTALCALYFDQKFRIRDANADLADYLVGLVDLQGRLEEPELEGDPEDDEL